MPVRRYAIFPRLTTGSHVPTNAHPPVSSAAVRGLDTESGTWRSSESPPRNLLRLRSYPTAISTDTLLGSSEVLDTEVVQPMRVFGIGIVQHAAGLGDRSDAPIDIRNADVTAPTAALLCHPQDTAVELGRSVRITRHRLIVALLTRGETGAVSSAQETCANTDDHEFHGQSAQYHAKQPIGHIGARHPDDAHQRCRHPHRQQTKRQHGERT